MEAVRKNPYDDGKDYRRHFRFSPRIVVIAALIGLVVAGLFIITDRASAAIPLPPEDRSARQIGDLHRVVPPPEECVRERKAAYCHKPWRVAKRLKSGRAGSSRGWWFPPKARRKINRAMARDRGWRVARRSQWWDKALSTGRCALAGGQMTNRLNNVYCLVHGRRRDAARRVLKWNVVCGGSAVLGTVGAGGVNFVAGGIAGSGCWLGAVVHGRPNAVRP